MKHKPYVYAVAECLCGFQSDHPDLRTAKEAAAAHRKAKADETAAAHRKEKAGETDA